MKLLFWCFSPLRSWWFFVAADFTLIVFTAFTDVWILCDIHSSYKDLNGSASLPSVTVQNQRCVSLCCATSYKYNTKGHTGSLQYSPQWSWAVSIPPSCWCWEISLPSGTQRPSLNTNSLVYNVRWDNSNIPGIDIIQFVVNNVVGTFECFDSLNNQLLSAKCSC